MSPAVIASCGRIHASTIPVHCPNHMVRIYVAKQLSYMRRSVAHVIHFGRMLLSACPQICPLVVELKSRPPLEGRADRVGVIRTGTFNLPEGAAPLV